MTAKSERQPPRPPDPYEEPLPSSGIMAIIVPLIFGCAIIISATMLWEAHARKIRNAEMAKIEEEVRRQLREAYREVRDLKPAEALALTRSVEEKMKRLKTNWPTDYDGLRMVMLLIEGEADFMLDCAQNAEISEKKFSRALSLMRHASGEMWQFGILGRARTRYELGRYEEAREDLNILIDRNPNFGSAFYWRAQVLEKLGDTEGAAADAARAKSLDSWPPLRDFMHSSCSVTSNLLTQPAGGAAH